MASEEPEFPIYRDLRHKIISGEIGDGARLIETALARNYQASRLHIKSALRLLEREHLAEHIPRRGFFAKSVTEEDIAEIIDLRIALERVVFSRFLARATEADIATLRHLIQRIAAFLESGMIDDAMSEVDRFYEYVYDQSGCWRITSILATYDEYLKSIRRRSADQTERNVAAYHVLENIVDAIEMHDAPRLMHEIERRRIEAE